MQNISIELLVSVFILTLLTYTIGSLVLYLWRKGEYAEALIMLGLAIIAALALILT